MNYHQKFYSVAALSLLISLTSCNDDDKNANQLSKDEAKNSITQFNADAVDDLQGLTDATGLQAVRDLIDLTETDDPFGRMGGTDKKRIKNFFQKKGRDFKTIFAANKAVGGRTANDEAFDFQANQGVYEWNPELGEAGAFEKTGDSEIIEILFPTEGSTTNNAALQLTEYSEVEVYDEEWDEYSYQPELLTAFLFVNDVKVVSLHLESAWDELGFPLTVDITLSIDEFTLDIAFDDSGAKSSSLSISFLRNTEVLVATSITVKYDDDSKSGESLNSIEGFVQVKNLKLQGDINIKAADATEVNWNDIINLALYSDNKKLGDVVFVEDDGEFIAYLQYADGTKEKLDTILQPVLDELDELESELDTNG
ncbi:MAG TPA: hypothetical protein PLJ60_06870 [Chryseolinea sp.]|nr:hypothetical protein [Chryseolinea sp.]HPM30041.1 hypothetical protein [Chryseolinea sp.]